jgi:hypothetical protein
MPSITFQGQSWPCSYGSWIFNYLCNQCLSSLMLWVRISIRARCTTLSNKVYQWLATGRWFSPGSPVSSTSRFIIILIKNAFNNIPIHAIDQDKNVEIHQCLFLIYKSVNDVDIDYKAEHGNPFLIYIPRVYSPTQFYFHSL